MTWNHTEDALSSALRKLDDAKRQIATLSRTITDMEGQRERAEQAMREANRRANNLQSQLNAARAELSSLKGAWT